MHDRLGFLSASGAVVAAIALVGVVGWSLVKGPVLFSPGALNSVAAAQTLGGVASHAELKGCGVCHPAPWSSQTVADRCLICHEDVAAQLQSGIGLHAQMGGSASSPTCDDCHTEHHGAKGALTFFDHGQLPFKLTGKHTGVACDGCHADARSLQDFRKAPRDCYGCHAGDDEHEGSFGRQCEQCHTTDSWTDATFDHDKASFRLTGEHAGVACGECHGGAKSLGDFRKAPRDCNGCHAGDDEHKGSFGRQCEQCHTTTGWGDVTFDHTVFPIDHGSDEQRATCKTCHPTGVSSYTCYGCHAHTPAKVRSQHEEVDTAQLSDCIECHEGGKSED